ncbi:MAG TPA: PKD domain-containing protein [Chitinophagaceae bacterium]
MKSTFLSLALLLSLAACSKKPNTPAANNHAPLATLASTITSADPFIVNFIVTASDEDGDALTYSWDFGDGTTKQGTDKETHTYDINKTYTAKVSVSDGKASPVMVSVPVNTTVTEISIDVSVHYQTMEGFGGFGAQDVYWSSGPFTSPTFVNTLINDLGLTILRDNVPTDFEDVNDDSDLHTTDLSKFHHNSLNDHFKYLKDMKAAGLNKLIVSIWSAPAWMKTNNNVNGKKADAPAYNPNPTSRDNQLRTDMYEEFAERCVAYIKIIKQETGIDVYAMSLQNEPRFTEPYESCVFNGDALRDLIKVVGKRFKDDNITANIFMPEDIGYLDGVSAMVQPTLNDAEARSYTNIIAVHGYAFDGVTANSPDAQTWQTMYSWGAAYGMPLWMTETSGFSNDMKGATDLAKAMYTAITFGNVSAWLHWQLSQQTLDTYSLMSSSGIKSKRYFASKNFYRYVRPRDLRIKSSAPDGTNIYPLAFTNDTAKTTAVILINDSAESRAIKIRAASLPLQFAMYVTSPTDDCKDYGTVNATNGILLPANSIVTLYKKN